MRKWMKRTAAAFAVSVLGVVTLQPTAVDAAPAPTGVYVTLSGNQSFAQSVVEAASNDVGYSAKVAILIPMWIDTLNSTGSLGATSITSSTKAEDLAQVRSVQAWLKNRSVVPRGLSATMAKQSVTWPAGASTSVTNTVPVPMRMAKSSGATPMFVNPDDPNSFEVRGNRNGAGNTGQT